MPERVMKPLPRLLADLIALTGKAGPSYPALWRMAVERKLPVEQGANGRYAYSPADLPRIAELLGLAEKRERRTHVAPAEMAGV